MPPQKGQYTEDDVAAETVAPAPRKVSAGEEAIAQSKAFGEGAKEMLTAPLWPGIKGMASNVFSELKGEPQSGKSVLTANPSQNPIDRLASAFLTLFGADVPASRANALSGNKGAAFVDLAFGPAATLGTSALLGKVLPKSEPSVGTRAKRLARASGAESAPVNMVKEYSTAMPDILETEKGRGFTSNTPTDLANVLGETLSRTENEFTTHLQPIAGNQVVPINIADKLRMEAAKFDTPNPESQRIRRALLAKATTFQKMWTIRQLDLERRNTYGRLHGFEKKAASGQRAALRTDEDVIADQIIEDGTRDLVYTEMERAYPQLGADYFRKLKQRQSAMLNVSDQMAKQLIKLGNLEAYDTLLDRLRGHSYVSSGGHVGFAVGNLLAAPVSESYKAGRQVRKGLAPRSNTARARALTSAVPLSRAAAPSLAPREDSNPTDEWATPQ